MSDLFYLAVTVCFFVVGMAFARACEALAEEE
jgi:hypothetical protein